MSAVLQVAEEPLAEEDILLLRRGRSGRSLTAVFAGLMFLLLASSAILFVVLFVSDRSLRRGADGVLVLSCAVAMAGFAVFLGRRLLRLPRAWRRFNQVAAPGQGVAFEYLDERSARVHRAEGKLGAVLPCAGQGGRRQCSRTRLRDAHVMRLLPGKMLPKAGGGSGSTSNTLEKADTSLPARALTGLP
ncbi:hypothetical protein D9M68_717290 [compost metagenome]|uniref:Transmembrane protein n=1 Tax=Achromobacter agilis TaxID=1353888 RepID=A0A446CD85_9BURK|nr:hypothetical protein AGI3411_02272 [Achromobacter agilis]